MSRNAEFQSFVGRVAATANSIPTAGNIPIEDLLSSAPLTPSSSSAGGSLGTGISTVRDLLGEVVSKIREHIVIRRAINIRIEDDSRVFMSYVHGKVMNNLTSRL